MGQIGSVERFEHLDVPGRSGGGGRLLWRGQGGLKGTR